VEGPVVFLDGLERLGGRRIGHDDGNWAKRFLDRGEQVKKEVKKVTATKFGQTAVFGCLSFPNLVAVTFFSQRRLANGNTLFVNCHTGPDNPQIIEVTPEKQVVWTFKDFTTFGNSLPVAVVLDP
jgi:hypothetical protein